jgi:hypothetical protein
MLKHKQVVFAAIAVTALLGYITPPAVQVAQATSFGEDLASGILDSVGLGDNDEEVAAEDVDDDDDDGVDQDLAQDLRQRQEASNEIDQDNEQTQDNDQRNSIETGDNTATNTAVTDNEQDVTAVSGDASAAAEAESEAKDGGSGHHDSKHKKGGHDGHDDGSTSSTAEAAAEAISAADARGTQDNDATAFSTQDSSVHDVTQTNDAHFALGACCLRQRTTFRRARSAVAQLVPLFSVGQPAGKGGIRRVAQPGVYRPTRPLLPASRPSY